MSLKRPAGTPAPERVDPATEQARKVFAAISTPPDEKPVSKQAVSFYVDPADYAALKTLAADMGIGIGAALRIAVRDLLKRRGAVQ